jgi:hypothetical protein
MADAPISRVRLRELARLGRSALVPAGRAGRNEGCASPRRSSTDASSIGERLPRRPRAASSRPEADEIVPSAI